MGLIHTAAILSRETEKALSYHSRPGNEKLVSEAIDGLNKATLVSRGKMPAV